MAMRRIRILEENCSRHRLESETARNELFQKKRHENADGRERDGS